jgi:polysaccharide pyruvyl transferase WcaK-like protein
MLIVSGGGQLTERSGPWGFPYAILIWIMMAKLAGVRRIFLNVGAGPLRHPLSKFFVRRSLYAANYVSFRDEPSQALARQIGFTGRSRVFPDNVYSLEVTIPKTSADARQGPLVGLAPMPWPFCDPREYPSENLQALYEEYLAKFATFASSLVRYSCSLDLFGSDAGADPSAIEDLRNVLRAQQNIDTPPYAPVDSVDGLLSRMAGMDYVVTCRFHGVVLAHILHKPVLAISHHPKVADLMSALGLSRYCVDIRNFDPISLADTFASLVDHTREVKSSMAESLAVYRLRAAAQFDELFPSSLNEVRHDLGREWQNHGTGLPPEVRRSQV